MTHADEPRPSIFALARQLVGGVVKLAKLEVAQGRQEIGEMLSATLTGVVMFAIAVLALVTLDIFFVLGLLALFEVLPPTASAIIIVAILVAVLALYGAFGAFSRLPTFATIGIVVAVVLLAVGFAVPAYLGFNAAWLSALFVFVLQLLLAGVFVARGIRHVRIGPPEQTIASVKEDIAWAKRLLKRG
jgi:putative superfamily III holin-X